MIFVVMTGHYEIFSWLDAFLSVSKRYEREDENNNKKIPPQ